MRGVGLGIPEGKRAGTTLVISIVAPTPGPFLIQGLSGRSCV